MKIIWKLNNSNQWIKWWNKTWQALQLRLKRFGFKSAFSRLVVLHSPCCILTKWAKNPFCMWRLLSGVYCNSIWKHYFQESTYVINSVFSQPVKAFKEKQHRKHGDELCSEIVTKYRKRQTCFCHCIPRTLH